VNSFFIPHRSSFILLFVHTTRETLLQKLRDPKAERAWEEFYEMYWRVIVSYAQKLGLDEAGAHDVLQETMVALLRVLPQFQYDPEKGKFRNFLLTIVHRKVLAAKRRAKAKPEVSFDAAAHEDGVALADVIADENSPQPSDAIEAQWQESIQEEALRRIREDASLQGRTWDVFEAYVLKQETVTEVAKRFQMKENAVYQIKNRMIRRLREEVQKLTRELEG
jgi:RNA polymerase sigma-70 factor (ECF subfamily)